MKKALALLVLAACVAVPASAQQGAMAVGGGLNFALPMGDFGNAAGFGIGFYARFQYGINDDISASGSLGYISFAEKNSISSSALPILVSGRYYFTPGDIGGGYEMPIGDKLKLDLGAGFNMIFTSGSTSTYIGIRGGVNYAL
jgi:hypothetical protein